MKRTLTALAAFVLIGLVAPTSSMAACEGDLNGDGQVDATDVEILGSVMGAQEGDAEYLPEADLDGDGVIGGTDFGALQRAAADGCS